MSEIPDVMRAAVLTGHGGLDRLVVRDDVVVPSPERGEVLIEVAAAGVNNTDINTRTGWYSKTVTSTTGVDVTADEVGSWGERGIDFPRIQGADIAGRIVDVGQGVEQHRVGERVIVDGWLRPADGGYEGAGYIGSERDGGFAEYVTVPAGNAYSIDSDYSDVELASFPCSYATAEHMLHDAAVDAHDWVLVTGASGGVGTGLVQLAKRRSARIIAVAGGSKLDAISGLGADHVIDRSVDVATAVRAITPEIDVFADVVGGDDFPTLFDLIRRGGRYVTAGAIAGPIVELDLRTLYLRDISMHGTSVLESEVFANLVSYIERSEVKPVVAGTFPLEEIHAAQEAFLAKQHVGCFVLEVRR